MADSNYPVNTTAKKAKQLMQWKASARDFVARTRDLFGEMTAHKDGSDYAGVETAYGLTTGDGDDVYGELNSVQGNALPAIVQLADRLG